MYSLLIVYYNYFMKINHEIQLIILKQLMYHPKARFRDLNKTDLTNDHFTFHLKRLIKIGLIEKENSFYRLTPKGLEITGRLDPKILEIIRPPKVGVCLFITRRNKGRVEILLQERLRDPFKGSIGSPTEKVRFGESFEETAARCLNTETGYSGTFKYIGAAHIIKKYKKEIILDVLLNYFKVSNLEGHFKQRTKEVRNFWIEVKKAYRLKNTFENHKWFLDKLIDNKLFFDEKIISS